MDRLQTLKQAVSSKVLLGILGVVLVTGIAFTGFDTQESPENDVIIISIDSLRKDAIDCGSGLTPNICELKNDSVSFEKGYTHASYTTPAMSTMLTSKHPTRNGLLDLRGEIPEDHLMLTEVMEDRGYSTSGFWEIGALDPSYGFNRSFDRYENTHKAHTIIDKPDPNISYIQHLENYSSPQFTWIHLYGLHFELRASQECWDYSVKLREEVPWIGTYDVEDRERANYSFAKQCYREQLEVTDQRVGAMIDTLKNRGKYEESMIIFTSDHGQGLGDNRIMTHTYSVYQEQVHVPFMIKFPDQDHRGKVKTSYARHVDIMPTVLDYLGINADYSPEGESLLDVINGKEKIRTVLIETEKQKALINRSMKLSLNIDSASPSIPEYNELYNISADPLEDRNLYRQRNQTADRMTEELLSLSPSPSTEGNLSNDLKQRLENLGYL